MTNRPSAERLGEIRKFNNHIFFGGMQDTSDCHVKELLAEIDALGEDLKAQRAPCRGCNGADTASIGWARCYTCRQKEAEENADLRAEVERLKEELATLNTRVWKVCDLGRSLHFDNIESLRRAYDKAEAELSTERAAKEEALREVEQLKECLNNSNQAIIFREQSLEQAIRERDEAIAELRRIQEAKHTEVAIATYPEIVRLRAALEEKDRQIAAEIDERETAWKGQQEACAELEAHCETCPEILRLREQVKAQGEEIHRLRPTPPAAPAQPTRSPDTAPLE